MEDLSDNQLITQYFKGDGKALEVLIKRYLKSIYNLAFRFTNNQDAAEDIAQETFVKAWKNLKKFKKDRNFKTWLSTIAKNTALDFLKKKKSLPFSAFENENGDNTLLAQLADINPGPSEIFEKKNLAQGLNSAVEKLKPDYRRVLFLYYQGCFNLQEIADLTGESLNTIKSRHRRAIIQLKKLM